MKNCLLCGRKSQRELYQKKEFSILECQCGLVWASALPSKKELGKFYSKTDYFRFWGKLDQDNLEKVGALKKKTFTNLLLQLKELQPQGRLLDVGCATGSLLEAAEEFGWQGWGVEPVKEFAQKAQKKFPGRVFQGLFEDYQQKDNFFNMMMMFDVLEHLPDPKAALKKVYQLLKQGGGLAISTPDLSSLSFRLLGPFWPHFKREHLFYFRPKTMERLLAMTGFEIKEIKPTKKFLNLAYAASYFQAFPILVLTPFLTFFEKVMPQKVPDFPFSIPTGNMTIVAVKK